jgi:hypothetical protein
MRALLLSAALGLVAPAFAQSPPAPAPAAAPEPAPASTARTAVTASMTIQVARPVEAADALVAKARELGGWFASRTDDRVELRVPVGAADALVAAAGELGKVADRGLERRDLTSEITGVQARLEAREEVLARYYEVLEKAGPKAIFTVERQVIAAIEQIERLRGQLRVLEDRADYARVDVAFRFRDRRAPKPDGTSSFAWLNSLDVQQLIRGLQQESPAWRTRGLAIQAPSGFSEWRKSRSYRAVSPDGVLFRARTVKHDPRADATFWQEAVRERMKAAGYRVVADEAREIGGLPGVVLELQAPLGEEDWTYLIAFVPDGRKIQIVEAAGVVTRFEDRRAAIVEAIEAMEP